MKVILIEKKSLQSCSAGLRFCNDCFYSASPHENCLFVFIIVTVGLYFILLVPYKIDLKNVAKFDLKVKTLLVLENSHSGFITSLPRPGTFISGAITISL